MNKILPTLCLMIPLIIHADEPVPTVMLAANSLVPLRMLETISSDTAQRGQRFRLEVTDDINVDSVVVIPAGSIAYGEVIDAAKARMLGKPGELSVSARFVTVGDRQIRLRASFGNSGKSNMATALLFNPFVHGRQMVIPADTELVAKLAVDEKFITTTEGTKDAK
jgi:hypothetical protein